MPIDYKRYPKDWKTAIVPRIIERANDCCEKCGVENRAELTSLGMWIRDGARYKYKRFWITNPADVKRLLDGPASDPKQVKVVLTVAHLDHDEDNHDVTDDRLMAMCQYCHLNYDAKEKYLRSLRKNGSHSLKEGVN